MNNRDRLLGLGVLLFCLVLWFWIIPQQTEHRRAAEFPHMVVIFMAFPALNLIISPATRTPIWTPPGAVEKRALRRSVILLGLTVLYMSLVPVVGFYVSSTLALVAFLHCLGEKRWRYLCCVPLGAMFVLYLAISRGLSFPMPSGWFF